MSSTDSDFEDLVTSPSHSGSRQVATDERENESSNLSVTTTSDFRKEYKQLIDDVEDLSTEDRSNLLGHQKELDKHVERSITLFESSKSTIGVSELYMASLHTKKLSEVLRIMSEQIGNSINSRFTVDKFILGVKQWFNDGVRSGEFSTDAGIENALQFENAICSKPAPIVGVIGLCSREFISSAPNPVKVKAPRALRKKKVFDQTNATQHSEVNLTKEQTTTKGTSALKTSMDVLEKLQACNSQNNEPIGLYDFTMDTSSLAKTIDNMYYISFLIRDGRVSVKSEGDNNLMLKPETPPENHDEVEREQHILSFSSRKWRALARASQGDNMIAPCPVAHSEPGNTTPGTSEILIESDNSSAESPEKMPSAESPEKMTSAESPEKMPSAESPEEMEMPPAKKMKK